MCFGEGVIRKFDNVLIYCFTLFQVSYEFRRVVGEKFFFLHHTKVSVYIRDARVTARGPDTARLYVTSGPRVIRGEYMYLFNFLSFYMYIFSFWNPSVGLLLLLVCYDSITVHPPFSIPF